MSDLAGVVSTSFLSTTRPTGLLLPCWNDMEICKLSRTRTDVISYQYIMTDALPLSYQS